MQVGFLGREDPLEEEMATHCSIFFFFFLAALGLQCCMSFSLVAASGCYSVVAVCWFLAAGASLVAEHGL